MRADVERRGFCSETERNFGEDTSRADHLMNEAWERFLEVAHRMETITKQAKEHITVGRNEWDLLTRFLESLNHGILIDDDENIENITISSGDDAESCR